MAQEILPDGDGFRAVTHIPVAVVETIVALRDSDGTGMDDVLAHVRAYTRPARCDGRTCQFTRHAKEGCEMSADSVTVSTQRPSASPLSRSASTR